MLSTQEKKNIPSDVFGEFRNASGCLGEQEMLWKQKLMGDCFHSIFKFTQTYMSVSIYNSLTLETWRTCFQFHLENTPHKKLF